jgi:hypothetical protein
MPGKDELEVREIKCPILPLSPDDGPPRDKFVILDMDETLLSAVVDTDPDYYQKRDQQMEPTFIVRSTHPNEEDKYRIKVIVRPYSQEVL